MRKIGCSDLGGGSTPRHGRHNPRCSFTNPKYTTILHLTRGYHDKPYVPYGCRRTLSPLPMQSKLDSESTACSSGGTASTEIQLPDSDHCLVNRLDSAARIQNAQVDRGCPAVYSKSSVALPTVDSFRTISIRAGLGLTSMKRPVILITDDGMACSVNGITSTAPFAAAMLPFERAAVHVRAVAR